MKALFVLSLALVAAGCSTPSKYANDPRAYLVGPDYLDYIDEYPADRDTQYYYPLFSLSGLSNWADPTATPATTAFSPQLEAMAIHIPAQTDAVRDITGQGWPKLEHEGVPFSASPNLPKPEAAPTQ